MPSKRDKASEKRRWPWWLTQPEVSFGGGGLLLLLLLAVAMLIYLMSGTNR